MKRWQLALAARRAKEKRAQRKQREEAERAERSKPRLVVDRDQVEDDQIDVKRCA